MAEKSQSGFQGLTAQSLYCAKCGQAQPVRSKLLLVLPQGEKYAYFCSVCGERLGIRMVDSQQGK
ncbi:hypothetical protein [Dethiosulfatarculus sandiegensis]|uniref:Cytoplasmic protein n=1 Tax=Dethiosulfatarculus sandiegensis TaxID=1429043 RepID=A0A0D2JK94_9BACT|nr:hypothetical protein [Dethiosulfatarculus sandiegensis]KIX16046.1 hypothetical protein X474_00565 [Dethiosulfatarculus sandiegensis]